MAADSIVNGGKLVAAYTAYSALFQGRLDEPMEDGVKDFVMERDSTQAIEKYHFMNPLGAAEEFDGEREFESLSAEAFFIENKPYSKGAQIGIDAINDDSIDIVKPTILSLADSVQSPLWMKLMANLLENGDSDLCYDGVAFFSASHPDEIGGTLLNVRANALSATNFETGCSDMESLKNSKGDPLLIKATHLMVPTALRATGESIVEIGPLLVGGDGAPNRNYKKCALIVNPFLTSATRWYLFDLSHAQKPFVRQKRDKQPTFVMDTDPAQESIKKFRRVEPYAEIRGAMGYALWQYAYAGTP